MMHAHRNIWHLVDKNEQRAEQREEKLTQDGSGRTDSKTQQIKPYLNTLLLIVIEFQ